MSGIMRSEMTMGEKFLWRLASAAAPLEAVETSNPAASTRLRSRSQTSGSSSTINTFGATATASFRPMMIVVSPKSSDMQFAIAYMRLVFSAGGIKSVFNVQ